MGYTHYWDLDSKIEPSLIATTIADMKRVCDTAQRLGIALANATGEPGTSPELDAIGFHFNGVGESSLEPFSFPVDFEARWPNGKNRTPGTSADEYSNSVRPSPSPTTPWWSHVCLWPRITWETTLNSIATALLRSGGSASEASITTLR